MTRRPPSLLLVLVLVAGLFTGGAAIASAKDPCGPGVEAIRAAGGWLCTHGNDDPPPGVDTTERPKVADLLAARFGADSLQEAAANTDGGEDTLLEAAAVACNGDGVSGARIQLVYAHASNVANRYNSVLPLLRQYAADADDVVNVSAGRVGDGRRVRYVTNSNCVPQVMNLTLSSTGDDSFSNMISELKAKGLNSSDRKYLVYMDAAVGICGLGQIYLNDRGDQANPNNNGAAMYARVDTSCWQHAVAHELLHTLGAVQNSAPNTSGAGHCTDEVDVMCYKDRSTTVIRYVCDRAGQVDCNNDDYFHPNPKANSYLDTKWNVARSRFLASTAPPPPPAETSVTVPSRGYAGVALPVRADISTSGATLVWSSTRDQCWFANPYAAQTTWTCPVGTTGDAQLTVMVTEGAVTTPYSANTSLVIPSTPLSTAVTISASSSSIMTGQSVTLRGRATQASTLAPLVGLTVNGWARPKGSRTWSRIGDARTNRSGIMSFTVAPQRNTIYRFVTVPTNVWAKSSSTDQQVNVQTKVTTRVRKRAVAGLYTRSRTRTRIAGAVSPNKAGKVIQLKVRRGGRWRVIRERRLNDNSRYAFRITTRTDRGTRLKVIKPRDRRNLRTVRNVVIRRR